MSKLLNKPFRVFTIYALVILVCSIPVYYLVIEYIWLKELDEHNQIVKEQIEHSFNTIPLDQNQLDSVLKYWNEIQPNISINISQLRYAPDSIYSIVKEKNYAQKKEEDRFRILISLIEIKGIKYHLKVETNFEETDETMWAIAFVTLLFFILLVIGFIVLNRRIAKQIWLPFQNTLEKLKTFDLTTQQTISFDKTDIQEFEALNESLHKLIDKNISIYKQQKTFIENASHELQTPLAILTSKIDLLLQNKDITNEQSEIINAIELPLARVSRINKNLLLLAKIENNQFAEKDIVEVTELTNETLELFTDYIEAKHIIVNKNFTEKLVVNCNKTLLEILISNLLINAIVHNVENGKINIDFSSNALTIANTGTIALQQDKIFKRFAISSSKTANSGLGLAIIKEICNRYQWQIEYSFSNQLHVFKVRF